MAFMVGEIFAVARADTGRFRSDMNQIRRDGATAGRDVNRSMESAGASVMRLGMLAKAAMGSALVLGARQAVREFALLEGAVAKFNVVFGEQADLMNEWVDQYRQNVPLARREIVQHAAAIQDLLVPMGIARDEASRMTREWLELAGALAAFNDVPVAQALDAITSGIAGQSRPLRALGIDVRETALQQTALAHGLMQTGEQMSEQVRLQALLIRSYEQSQDAIDGYEDQLDSTLMKEQELQATYKDTLAVIGQELQPAYNELIGELTRGLKYVQENIQEFRNFIAVLRQFHDAILNPIAIMDEYVVSLDKVRNGLKRLYDVVLAPWNLIDWGKKEVEEASEAVTKATDSISDDMDDASGSVERFDDEVKKVPGSVGYLRERIKDLKERIDESFDRQTIQGYMSEILRLEKQIRDMTDAYDPGTVGHYRDRIIDLKNQIERTFDPELIRQYQDEIRMLTNVVDNLLGTLKPDTRPAEFVLDVEQALRDADEAMEEFLTTTQEVERSISGGFGRLDDEIEKSTDAARFFSQTLGDGLAGVLFQSRSLEDSLKNIIRLLASRALTTLIFGLLSPGGFGAGGFLGAMFGGFRASGGGVSAGKSYVVGERGPELFLPSSSGTIVPNHQMSSGRVSLNVHVTGEFADRGNALIAVVQEQVRQIDRLI